MFNIFCNIRFQWIYASMMGTRMEWKCNGNGMEVKWKWSIAEIKTEVKWKRSNNHKCTVVTLYCHIVTKSNQNLVETATHILLEQYFNIGERKRGHTSNGYTFVILIIIWEGIM